MSTIGDRIREKRISAGMTVDDLAERIAAIAPPYIDTKRMRSTCQSLWLENWR